MSTRKRRSFSTLLTPATHRAVLYVRYSSDMQRDGWSVEAQLTDLRRYCARMGWAIVGELVDEARSGKTEQRPGFQQALHLIRSGAATIFVVHKLDRFSRNMEHTFRLVNEFEQLGAGLVCIQQGIDTTNPISGKIVLAVLAALAETYLDNLSEETSKGKRARVEAGLPNGHLPYGYRNPDAGTERSGSGVNNCSVPVVVPERAAVVRQAFARYATGQYSHATLAQALNAAGYRMVSKRHPAGYPWTKDTVTALLRNDFYIGKVHYGNAVFDGQHEPIVDAAVFERVQALHARKARAGRRGSIAGNTRVYVAAGLVQCACCRQPLRATMANGRTPVYVDRSRERGIACTAARRSVEGQIVDAAIAAAVASLRLPDDWRARVLAEAGADDDAARRAAIRRAALEQQLEQAQRYLLDGLITEAQFREKRAALEAERATLTEPAQVLDGEAAAALLEDLAAAWAGATEEERREIARALFEAIWVDLDGKRVVAVHMKNTLLALRNVFSSDAEGDDYCRMRNRRDSNPRSPA